MIIANKIKEKQRKTKKKRGEVDNCVEDPTDRFVQAVR